MDRFGLIILTLLIFSSCTKQGSTPTKIQVSSVALDTAVDVLNQNLGGLYMYGFGPNGARFGKVLNENSFNETLPNGTWSFYVVGWAGLSGVNLSGATKCASAKNIQLNGTETNLGLTITTANCGTSDFTNIQTVNYVNGIAHFPFLMLESCKDFPAEATRGVGNSQDELCEYDMDLLSKPRRKGYFSSFRVYLPNFKKTSNSQAPIFEEDSLSSICLPVSNSKSGSVEIPAPSPSTEVLKYSLNLNLPVGNTNAPFPLKVRGYYSSTDCTSNALGFKDLNLLNGRFHNSPDVKTTEVLELTTNGPWASRLYLKASDQEVCSGENLNALGFSGGLGSPGLPYLICNTLQFNDINTVLSSGPSFRLVNDLNFQFGFGGNGLVPVGADLITSSNSDNVNFSGVFDGNRHKLENISLIKDLKGTEIDFFDLGIFRQATNAKFLDLRVENVSVECRSGEVTTTPTAISEKCFNTGILVGEASNSDFQNIYIKGHIVGADNVGGMVGRISGPANFSIDQISLIERSFTDIIINSDCPANICTNLGGLVGESTLAEIKNSSVKLSLHGDDISSIGGLVGKGINTVIDSSSSFGEVSGHDNIGGLAGLIDLNLYTGTQVPTSSVFKSFSHAYVFARDNTAGASPKAGGLVGDSLAGNLPIQRSYHAVGKVFANDTQKGLFGGGTNVSFSFSFRPSFTPSCNSSSTSECLTTIANVKSVNWLNGNIESNFVNQTSSAFEISTGNFGDDGKEYPRHKWESQLETTLGYKVPFLERKCSGKLAYSSPSAEGAGTEANPYIICTVAQLTGPLWSDSTKHFKLMRDLDFENGGNLLGDSGKLGAAFDGNNFTFKNYFKSTDTAEGIWKSISVNGKLKNLRIKHSRIQAASGATGSDVNNFGFIASNNDGLIQNVSFDSSEYDMTGWTFGEVNSARQVSLGGLVGLNVGEIKDSRSGGQLKFFDQSDFGHYDQLSIGSIAGVNKGLITQSSGRFELNINSNAVASNFSTNESSDTVFLGGVVGVNDALGVVSESESEFKIYIRNFSEVSTGLFRFGGIAGVNAGEIENTLSPNMKTSFYTQASPNNTAPDNTFIGGIAGENLITGKIKKSIAFLSEVDPINNNQVGGIVGKNSISSDDSTFLQNNLCIQEEDISVDHVAGSYSGDSDLSNLCLIKSIIVTSSGTNLSFEDSSNPARTLSISDMSFTENKNPNETQSIWILDPESGDIELRATKYWFNDI